MEPLGLGPVGLSCTWPHLPVPSEQAELCFDPWHAPSISLWSAVLALLGEEDLNLDPRTKRKAGPDSKYKVEG